MNNSDELLAFIAQQKLDGRSPGRRPRLLYYRT
jgi:hypothetical protein